LPGFDRVKINARNKGVKALPKHRFAFVYRGGEIPTSKRQTGTAQRGVAEFGVRNGDRIIPKLEIGRGSGQA
jgi:hypothetical protein